MKPNKVVRLVLDLTPDPALIPTVRATIRLLLGSLGIDAACAGDLELVVGELATNVVLHASRSERYQIAMTVSSRADGPTWVRIAVSDRGNGFAVGPTRPAAAVGTGSETRFGGWGLPLVRALTDHVTIRPTWPHADPCGTTVRVTKRLPSTVGA